MRVFADPGDAVIQSLRSRSRDLGKIIAEIALARDYLDNLERLLDGVLMPPYVFDLTSPATVGEVIVYKLEQQPKVRLSELQRFYGSGVYIFYYHGSFPAYEAISGTNVPIYVGSKGPKVKNADTPKQQGIALFDRINEHLNRSIIKANTTLDAADFHCRYLVVQSGLELGAEEFLIRRYLPVWNDEARACSGLGKHGDVARAEKSEWDVLHPGRSWAAGQTSRAGATPETITAKVQAHFARLLLQDRAKWSPMFNAAWVLKQEAVPTTAATPEVEQSVPPA
jgi:hypothetical protein